MTGGGRCAVVAGQGGEGSSDGNAAADFEQSVDDAIRHGAGSFDEVVSVTGAGAPGDTGPCALHQAGAGRARELDAEEIGFLGPDETLSPEAFDLVSPAVQSNDAVWGGLRAGTGGRNFPDQAYANYFLAPRQLGDNGAATNEPTGRK